MIGVVTSLDAQRHHAIAAARFGAIVAAAVGIKPIAVIAGLTAYPDVAITAARHAAIIQTSVGLDLITLVAFFIALLFRAAIVALRAVTANGELANAGAGVAAVGIAVVAGLVAGPNHSVTAGCWGAGV